MIGIIRRENSHVIKMTTTGTISPSKTMAKKAVF